MKTELAIKSERSSRNMLQELKPSFLLQCKLKALVELKLYDLGFNLDKH